MILKPLCSILVFLQVGFFAYLPYLYPRIHSNRFVTTLISCFSSGLFLGLSLLHVLPESNQLIASSLALRSQGHQHLSSQHSHHGHQHEHLEQLDHHHNHGVHGHEHTLPYGSVVAILTFIFILGIETYFHNSDASGHSHGHSHNHSHHQHQHHSQESLEHKYDKSAKSTFVNSSKVLLTQFALSIHSFFECMSMGVQVHQASVLTLLFGILIHKWAEGLTLGYAYKSANMPKQLALKYALFHACLNGGAVLVGWTLSEINPLLAGILSSVSAGTFLYVCMVEKIQHEFSSSENLSVKLLSMVVGVIFVCIIT